jgi:peptidoglycan/xylan/chitin deacetylase (PgdA/CDA1 family)
MKALSLGYHDVTEEGVAPETTRRPAASHYRLSRARFREHLGAFRDAGRQVSTIAEPSGLPLFLTFDDGGAGADSVAADELERVGWRGHFFITSDWIGCPGFLDARSIRRLHGRGHVIGSHTRSHPSRMAHLGWEELISEWKDSRSVLEDIVGEAVDSASVADGYYSREVGRAAAACGIRYLFNSEPTQAVAEADGCLVFGRYAILASTSASQAMALACGKRSACYRQSVSWRAKKLVKTIAGDHYLGLRRAILARRRG